MKRLSRLSSASELGNIISKLSVMIFCKTVFFLYFSAPLIFRSEFLSNLKWWVPSLAEGDKPSGRSPNKPGNLCFNAFVGEDEGTFTEGKG
jgi:hypothetical protein